MFELSNEQRKCFALQPVLEDWLRINIKASPYDDFQTFAYVKDNTIVKCILVGDNIYSEYELNEQISNDQQYLLPKTAKGKAVLLSSSNLLKRSATGMCLSFNNNYISLYNRKNKCSYYSSAYEELNVFNITQFENWVNNWCEETTKDDISDIEQFALKPRQHIKYKEGDVFRFKINRRLYGYGRIILNYDKMRKEKQPFWDILMGKPLVCNVYHIAKENPDVELRKLKQLNSLPSVILADNNLYYGEYEIIGNIPVTDNEDYPIMYGNSISYGENAVCLQYGKVYKKIENEKAIYKNFKNNGVGFNLSFNIDILMQCIKANSNKPYWENYYPSCVNNDLRNPKFKKERKAITKQMKVPFKL